MIDKMLVEAKAEPKEWEGSKSAKFTTSKRHIAPHQPENGPHPLFNMGGRTHFQERRAPEWQFKATKQMTKAVDHE